SRRARRSARHLPGHRETPPARTRPRTWRSCDASPRRRRARGAGHTDPTALVAAYEWDRYLDVVTLRGADWTTAARVPKQGKVDIFAPERVVWAYQGHAQPTLQALLNLVHPDHPDAPTDTFPAPQSLYIPRPEQRPLLIRPPSPHKATARATRLAAAMTSSVRESPKVIDPEG
ncbi:MAG: hypothetical protein ACRDT0_17605, partial [Pseudonocardiaceae bacterium]